VNGALQSDVVAVDVVTHCAVRLVWAAEKASEIIVWDVGAVSTGEQVAPAFGATHAILGAARINPVHIQHPLRL
jgi:hypothetical protein